MPKYAITLKDALCTRREIAADTYEVNHTSGTLYLWNCDEHGTAVKMVAVFAPGAWATAEELTPDPFGDATRAVS